MEYKLLLILPKDITLNYELFSQNVGLITGMRLGSPPLSLATIAALTPVNFNMLNASNIIPKNMSVEQLQNGILWLLKELYKSERFIERLKIFFNDFEKSDKKGEIEISKTFLDFAVIGIVLRLTRFLLFRATSSEKYAFFKMFKIVLKSSHPQRFGILLYYFIRLLNYQNFLSEITRECCQTNYSENLISCT